MENPPCPWLVRCQGFLHSLSKRWSALPLHRRLAGPRMIHCPSYLSCTCTVHLCAFWKVGGSKMCRKDYVVEGGTCMHHLVCVVYTTCTTDPWWFTSSSSRSRLKRLGGCSCDCCRCILAFSLRASNPSLQYNNGT